MPQQRKEKNKKQVSRKEIKLTNKNGFTAVRETGKQRKDVEGIRVCRWLVCQTTNQVVVTNSCGRKPEKNVA